MLPFITIVVPVRNEARFIRETLLQLLQQDYPRDRFEIIVADGCSDDDTTAIVGRLAVRHPQLRLVRNEQRRSSAGRNLGFRQGRGDLFLVVDGHCHIGHARLLRNLAECLRQTGAYCLGRPQPLDPPGLSRFQRAVAAARGSRFGHNGGSLIYGEQEGYDSPVSNGAAYRREVFELVGYVDEQFDACEDVEFNYRVQQHGLLSYTSPGLTVRYYPREDPRGLLRQMSRYGAGRFRLVLKHPQTLTVNTLVPPLFTLAVLLAPLILALAAAVWLLGAGAEVARALLAPGAAVAGLYLILNLGTSLWLAWRRGTELLPWLPVIFFLIHFGLGLGFLQEWLRCHYPRTASLLVSVRMRSALWSR